MQGMVPLCGFGGVPYSAVRKAAPRNLLDNSDFRNPVNQRGITSETSVPAYSYFIDRWVNQTNEARSYALSANGITLPLSTTLLQKIEKVAEGTVLTFAIKLSDGTIALLTGTTHYTSDGTWTRFASVTHSFGDMYMETMNDVVNVVVYNTEVITIVWAALYEGEYTAATLPEYQPKGYGAELAECQRYFWRMNNSNGWGVFALGWEQSSTNIRYIVMVPVQMRIKPSVAYAGDFCVTIGTKDTSEVTTMSIDSFSGTYIQLSVAIPTQSIVKYRLSKLSGHNDSTAHIDFIADL